MKMPLYIIHKKNQTYKISLIIQISQKPMLRTYLWLQIFLVVFVFTTEENQFNKLKTQGKKSSNSLEISFQDYIAKFHKIYQNEVQKLWRQQIYNENVDKIKKSNCSVCGITKFTDRLESQVSKLKGNTAQQQPETVLFASGDTLSDNKTANNSQIPKTFDWRDYGVVTSIKDQQGCGNCWAFSTVAFFQGQLIRRDQANYKIDLSEQYLLQCDSKSNACSGGNLYSAMDLVLSRSLPLQKDYPFSPKFWYPGICVIGRGPTFPFSRRVTVYNLNDDHVIEYLLQRPLNIGIKSKNWQNYAPTDKERTFKCDQIKKGISQFNHAVLLIGYTQKEWIVKNQWGSDWGVDGYMYISRDAHQNCGIGLEINTLNTKLASVLNSTKKNGTTTKNDTTLQNNTGTNTTTNTTTTTNSTIATSIKSNGTNDTTINDTTKTIENVNITNTQNINNRNSKDKSDNQNKPKLNTFISTQQKQLKTQTVPNNSKP